LKLAYKIYTYILSRSLIHECGQLKIQKYVKDVTLYWNYVTSCVRFTLSLNDKKNDKLIGNEKD